MPTVDLEALFDTRDPAVKVERLESLKTALASVPFYSPGDPRSTFVPAMLQGQEQIPTNPVADLAKALANPEITKALGADVLSSVQAQLDAQPDLVKDLTLTSPLSTGYVAYDLEAPAKMLTPRPTPLRNRIPRGKGIGTAHRYKRITGHTGTGTGVGNLFPGITDSTTNTFGSLSLLRGPKISYQGDEASVPYLQFSLSDQVPWSNQFSAQGFQDMRALSNTALLYSSMLMEERMLLGSRGTASGFLGALTAPASVTVTTRAAVTGEVGNTANIASFTVGVTAITQFGETVATFAAANVSLAATTGRVADIQVPVVVGAQAYKVYVGTTGVAATSYAANTLTVGNATPVTAASYVITGPTASYLGAAANTVNVLTLNFTGGGTGGLPAVSTNTPPTVATDSNVLAYDGIVPICQGANSGYTKILGTTYSSNPGDEYNQAFAFMYDQNKADPDEILFNGNDRKQLSDLIKLNSNTSAYRISVGNEHDATIGVVVNALQNEVTGKMVNLTVHPWLFQGVTPILSWTLPIPDTQVSDCWKVFNVQDYMSAHWPVNQFAYESSSYWYGTFLCYAAAWQGCISGIVRK